MTSQDSNNLPENPTKKEWSKPEVIIINGEIESGPLAGIEASPTTVHS